MFRIMNDDICLTVNQVKILPGSVDTWQIKACYQRLPNVIWSTVFCIQLECNNINLYWKGLSADPVTCILQKLGVQ